MEKRRFPAKNWEAHLSGLSFLAPLMIWGICSTVELISIPIRVFSYSPNIVSLGHLWAYLAGPVIIVAHMVHSCISLMITQLVPVLWKIDCRVEACKWVWAFFLHVLWLKLLVPSAISLPSSSRVKSRAVTINCILWKSLESH